MADKKRHRDYQESRKRIRLSPEDATTNTEECPGKIKKMVLKNFMCHKNLEFKFDKNVTIISGCNGSGKSAILTAVIIGLGGRTQQTNRATNLRSLIRSGQHKAVVEITLSNTGNLPYKREMYGNEIKVMRIISEKSSTYKIMSEKGKNVSCKKDELENLLKWFNIQVYNPVVVLNQDTARNFLKSADPHQLYTFFMKGTLLEDIYIKQVTLIEEKLPNLLKTVNDKQVDLNKVSEDIMEMKRKLEQVEELHKLEEKIVLMQNELYWTIVGENMKKLRTAQETLLDLETQLPRLRKELEKKETFTEELQTKMSDTEERLKKALREKDEKDEKQEDAEKMNRRLDADHNQISHQVKELNKKITHNNKTINALDTEINIIQSSNAEIETKRRESEIERKELEDRLTELRGILKTSTVHKQQLQDTSLNHTDLVNEKVAVLNRMKNELKNTQYMLQNLKSDKSELSVYGHWMPQFIDAINKADQRKLFKYKPIGPIGNFIKVKEKSWAPAVEAFLGRKVLSAFCCHCSQDSQILSSIIKKMNIPRNFIPSLVCSPFKEEVYNVKGTEVLHSKFYNLMQSLTFDNHLVCNSLIDQLKIEKVLLVDSARESYPLMENVSSVPHLCKRVITKEGHTFYPAPYYRSYSGHVLNHTKFIQVDKQQNMRRLEDEISRINLEISKVEVELSKMKVEERDGKKKLAEAVSSVEFTRNLIEEATNRLSNINYDEDGITHHLQLMLQDKEIRRREIDLFNVKIKELESKTDRIKVEIQEASLLVQKLHQEKSNSIVNINELKVELTDVKGKLMKVRCKKIEKGIIENHLRKIEKFKKQVETLKEDVRISQETALKASPNINTTRKRSEVESDLHKVTSKAKALEVVLGVGFIHACDNYLERIAAFKSTMHILQSLNNTINKLKNVLDKRSVLFNNLRGLICANIKHSFNAMMSIKNYKGELCIEHSNKEIMLIVHRADRVQSNDGSADCLSGGERSYSMVSFILALWKNMNLPFYFLDEFDVYMDNVSRSMVISLLTEHASSRSHQQFVFLTPHNVSAFISDKVAIYRMSDPDRKLPD